MTSMRDAKLDSTTVCRSIGLARACAIPEPVIAEGPDRAVGSHHQRVLVAGRDAARGRRGSLGGDEVRKREEEQTGAEPTERGRGGLGQGEPRR